ncbi:MAG: 50S ribosomal protein L22 [Phycisphaera sp.]|nr:50S ribosomal protein L22 [Phycisphaera sp.]
MPYKNIHRNARISPKKCRLVADLVRGKSIGDALAILELSKKRGAVYVRQALLAAQANAEQAEVDTRSLFVSEARVDDGVRLKRFQPKDRGRAHSIIKRCSNITITVDPRV